MPSSAGELTTRARLGARKAGISAGDVDALFGNGLVLVDGPGGPRVWLRVVVDQAERCTECGRLAGMITAPCQSCPDYDRGRAERAAAIDELARMRGPAGEQLTRIDGAAAELARAWSIWETRKLGEHAGAVHFRAVLAAVDSIDALTRLLGNAREQLVAEHRQAGEGYRAARERSASGG